MPIIRKFRRIDPVGRIEEFNFFPSSPSSINEKMLLKKEGKTEILKEENNIEKTNTKET